MMFARIGVAASRWPFSFAGIFHQRRHQFRKGSGEMAKAPAFQFYAKDWLSSATVSRMSLHHQGIYIRLLAAAWDSEEPGTLPLPIEIAARSARLDPRSLRDFMAKSPRCFIEVGGKLVNLKLAEQWAKYKEISEKRSNAAQSRYPANAQQKHHSASASAFASAKSNTKTPLPPAIAGDSHETFISFARETIAVKMGRRRRLPSFEAYQGGRASDVVEFLNRKGFEARLVTTQ